MLSMFLGEKVEYWLALQSKVDCLNVSHLIREIAELRKKVSFYESRLNEIEEFRKDS